MGKNFFEFVHGTLIPEMEPLDGSIRKSIVILDNCSVHHIVEVKQGFNDAGILVIYLPPYSPDLNLIEETFGYVKYYLKDHSEVMQSLKDPKLTIRAVFKHICWNVLAMDKSQWLLLVCMCTIVVNNN